MSSWNLLGKGYEKIPPLASANLRGDYRAMCPNLLSVLALSELGLWNVPGLVAIFRTYEPQTMSKE